MIAFVRRLLALASAALFGGFLVFAGWVSGPRFAPAETPPRADAIVALTGGGGMRIAEGVALLEAQAGDRLLISGVHPEVSTDDVRRLGGGSQAVFACCVDLGRAARTTIGNALEIAQWAETAGYRSLIVVTSDYHMPRSLRVIRAALGEEVALAPWPVRRADAAPWWRDLGATRRLFWEYLKYLVILAGDVWADMRGARTG